MAAKTIHPEQQLPTIESLREKHHIARPVFAGVCAANGWRPGRAMAEGEFLQAVSGFTRAPMGPLRGSEAKK